MDNTCRKVKNVYVRKHIRTTQKSRKTRFLDSKRKKLFVRQRKKERTGDALALEDDEGRD